MVRIFLSVISGRATTRRSPNPRSCQHSTSEPAILRERQGQPATIIDPSTGQPFANNQVPVSPQAAALLNLYPLPNVTGNPLYNFQIPVLNSSHQDVLQSRMDKTIGRRDQVYGTFNFKSIRADAVNLFSFVDTTDTLGTEREHQLVSSSEPASLPLRGISFQPSACAGTAGV